MQTFLSRVRSNTASPAGKAGEVGDGHAGAYSATNGGPMKGHEPSANGLPFGTHVAASFEPAASCGCSVGGAGASVLHPRVRPGSAMCLSAVPGSVTLLPPRRKRSQRASRVLSHLALLPGAGRLHVNVGWRHPRPVAADDRQL